MRLLITIVLFSSMVGNASASNQFLGEESQLGKNSYQGEIHRGSTTINARKHRICDDSGQEYAADCVVAPKTAQIPGGPFKGFPDRGRGTVKWGTGAKDAVARAAEITAEEAKALDPAQVRAAKQFYEGIFKEFPDNAAAKARAELMDRILELQGGK